MSLYSSIVRNTAFPVILKRENRLSALGHWHFFDKSQYWSRQRLLDYQWEKLKQILLYAYENCPYYTGVFNDRGLTPESFKGFEDLSRLPILTRDLLFDKKDEILSRKFKVGDVQEVVSGGTTGQQAIIHRNYESFNIKMGMGWRHESWMGRKPCDKMAFFWPAHADFFDPGSWKSQLKVRHILREAYYYAGSAKPEILRPFYDDLTKFRPDYLKAFPNPLAAFTQFVMDNGLKIRPIKGILSTGEVLSVGQRKIFEDIFGCSVFDMYGSREVGNTASECSAHEGLHIAMETSLVEFVVDNRPAEFGEEGEILITDLTNYAFPMIRYQINDYGIPLQKICSCGRELLLMSPAVGRLQDFYFGPDGTRHPGLVLAVHIVSDHHIKVGQAQFIQKSLTDFHVKVLRKPEPTRETLEYIRQQMKIIVGDGINITIEVVDEIPREKSGKVRFVKCEIPGIEKPANSAEI
jgi:phenylacetate-CoA ligase